MAVSATNGSDSGLIAQSTPSTSFSLPPGLSCEANGAPSTGLSEREALLADVRKEAMAAVEAKVDEKLKDMWSKGIMMMKKQQEENAQKNAQLLAELNHVKTRQDLMQAEHEALKTTLQSFVHHLNVIGAAFGGSPGAKVAAATNGTHGTVGSTSATTGDARDSSAASASSLQDSPSEFSAPSYTGFPQLPELPPFPFPPAAASTPLPTAATPLSLAEALGSEASSTPSVPVSLMGSLPQMSPGPKMFSFTLRKADGTDLGLNVSHHEEDTVLRVESVRAEGAVEAWNRQCIGSTASEKAVMPGDRIVSVNNISQDPKAMLEECRDKQLLKLTVVRGGPVPETSASTEAPKSTTTLRAEASEFVPSSTTPGGVDAKSEEPEFFAALDFKDKEEKDKENGTEKAAEC